MYKLIPWSSDLDLSAFYAEAERCGFTNNSSQQVMVDCFAKEERSCVWILYRDDRAVGSVAAHSLPELGLNSYRICARTCIFADARPIHALGTANRQIKEHQNLTAQFFIPMCIEWCGADSNMYISSHPSEVGKQRPVHNIYCPTLVKTGTLERTCELEYRGHLQTFWKLKVNTFLTQLNQYPRWN
jgi:hypothetical protein